MTTDRTKTTRSRRARTAPGRRRPTLAALALLALGLVLALPPGVSRADDKDLLRESGGKPYVFVVLDTSASMNQKIGTDDPTALAGDDPTSKIYLAKKALYNVIKATDNVHFGFGTNNHDRLRVIEKTFDASGVAFVSPEDIDAINTCGTAQGPPASGKEEDPITSWEWNDDSALDPFTQNDSTSSEILRENLKYPTAAHPSYPELDVGDMIPLSWESNNKDSILERLAPNGTNFGVAGYFQDTKPTGRNFLALRDPSQRPLVATGKKSLGPMIRDFRNWYAGCDKGSCNHSFDDGWRYFAAQVGDRQICQKVFLLVITDGTDDDCSEEWKALGYNRYPNPASWTGDLKSQENVKTFVVSVGSKRPSGSVLNQMANNGGGELFYAGSESGLVSVLDEIFGRIREETIAFASAAVPSVQAEVSDKIFLANLTPAKDQAIWRGSLQAFLKPLPIDADGRPDASILCDADTPSACLAWNAADQLVQQIDGNDRRVYYSAPTSLQVPDDRRDFELVASIDPYLWSKMGGIDALRVADTIQKTLAIKESPNPLDPTQTVRYALGDVFHSDPVLIGGPSNFRYFSLDVGYDPDPNESEPYSEFFVQHERRRKILFVGANDGMLHAFDAGIYRTLDGTFDNGSGKELFAYIPSSSLSGIRDRVEFPSKHIYGVDGSPAVDDVFIDPKWTTSVTETDREWRTVVVGGLREGGTGYYALDVTQPDTYGTTTLPDGTTVPVPQPNGTYRPSCSDGGSSSACGNSEWPAVLWEFTDADLGFSWSKPTLGRIRVCNGSDCDPSGDDGDLEDRYVAIFGGGMPRSVTALGDAVYMVDVETGRILWKEKVEGSVPAQLSAVDTDQNGYLDTIYFGTTSGFLYKTAIADEVNGTYPTLVSGQIDDVKWQPRKIFESFGNGAIYYPPSVVYVADVDKYALAFGTGNRQDLWVESVPAGRFYLFTDETAVLDPTPLDLVDEMRTEAVLEAIAFDGADVSDNRNLLTNPNSGKDPGWVLLLEDTERTISSSFALSGLLVFNTYLPRIDCFDTRGNVISCPEDTNKDILCSSAGSSRSYIVYTTNANRVPGVSYLDSASRFLFVGDNFLTNPYTEAGQTKNETPDPSQSTADDLGAADSNLRQIMESLKGLFPSECKFGAARIDIKAVRSDTGVEFIAPVPVCLIEKNWKEH